MRREITPTRAWAVAAIAAVTLVTAGCANERADEVGAADQAGAPAETPPDAPASVLADSVAADAGEGPAAKAAPAAPVAEPAPPTTQPPAPARVEVDVEVGPSLTVLAGEAPATTGVADAEDATIDATTEGAIDAASGGVTATGLRGVVAASVADPFGQFATCSGIRQTLSTWSLVVSDPSSAMTAVSIYTVAAVHGPGTFEGFFRVEWENGASLDATGTVTLDPGLQTGSFAAGDADLRGRFACTGAPAPRPLDGKTVEVSALVKRGSAERIISLAAPYQAGVADCTADGTVRVVGDAGVGAPVEFTVASGGSPTISVGGAALPLVAETVTSATLPDSGVVHAETVDGLTIDAAYRCS